MLHDLCHAVRIYLRHPGLPAAAVVVLALGIGVNLAVLMLVNTVLFRPMPRVRNEANLVLIGRTFRTGGHFQSFSYPDFADVRRAATSFEQVAAYRLQRYALRSEGQTDRVTGEAASDNYLDALQVRLAAGRWFQPNEANAAVISDRLWDRRWSRSPGLLGQTVQINGVDHTIVGVTEEGFRGGGLLGDADLFTPLAGLNALDRTFDHLGHRDASWLAVFGRLKPGVTRDRADSELAALGVALRAKHALDFTEMLFRTARYNALHEDLRWDSITVFLAVLTGLTLVTVLVVCANVANLLLARMATRRREIAIRLSLGAGRGGIVRQFLVEGLVLGVAGVLAGGLVAGWAADWLAAMVPSDGGNKVVLDLVWDGRLMAYSAALAIGTTLCMALPAAWQSSQASVLSDLKAGEAGQVRTSLRAVLAVAQVALCMVLIAAAALAARSARELRLLARDVPATQVSIASVELAPGGYSQERGKAFLARLHERLTALPGVESVALANMTAFSGSATVLFGVSGGNVPAERRIHPTTNLVSPGYFRTLGLPLLAGRDFLAGEGQRAIVINEPLARRMFPDRPAAGQRVLTQSKQYPDFTVVGVVQDRALDLGRNDADEPRAYFLLRQFDNHNLDQTIHVRSALAPAAVHQAIRAAVAELDPHLPVFGQNTLAGVMEDQSMFTQKMIQAVGGYSSAMAIVVAAIGLYGLIAFRVAQRTREIGLRIALGASPGDILRRVLREGWWIGLGGIALGSALVAAMTRVLVGVLYGVKPVEPLALALAAGVLLAATLVACALPAWRATRIAPGVALRWE